METQLQSVRHVCCRHEVECNGKSSLRHTTHMINSQMLPLVQNMKKTTTESSWRTVERHVF